MPKTVKKEKTATMTADSPSPLKIAQPLTLKSGLVLPNRLVKAAMAEGMADPGTGHPSEGLKRVYSEWAKGGWGMVITGNVQVDRDHMGGPLDVSLPSSSSSSPSSPDDLLSSSPHLLQSWKSWATASTTTTTNSSSSPKVIIQLSHPGRQSPLGSGTRPGGLLFSKTLSPSPIPLSIGQGIFPFLLRSLVFGTPRALTIPEIKEVIIPRFAAAARLAAESGFHGVEIHAAHGYLLAQFLSKNANRRDDEYGGDAKGRCRILVEILEAVREEVKGKGGKNGKKKYPGFTVGVKLNSVDYQQQQQQQQDDGNGNSEDMQDFLEQLSMITSSASSSTTSTTGESLVDFIEISGGSYEDPKFVIGAADDDADHQAEEEEGDGGGKIKEKSARTAAREAFFLEFARAIRRHVPDIPLLVTGGFRTRAGMEAALGGGSEAEEEEKEGGETLPSAGGCDLIGLGRPSVLDPMAAKKLLDKDHDAKALKIEGPDPKAMPWLLKYLGLHFIGAGADTVYYVDKLQKIGLPTSPAK